MRNAVIRKKLIKEQTMIRRFFLYPQRLIVAPSGMPLPSASDRLWHVPSEVEWGTR